MGEGGTNEVGKQSLWRLSKKQDIKRMAMKNKRQNKRRRLVRARVFSGDLRSLIVVAMDGQVGDGVKEKSVCRSEE